MTDQRLCILCDSIAKKEALFELQNIAPLMMIEVEVEIVVLKKYQVVV